MTTTFDNTITSERPAERSGSTNTAQLAQLPVLFWAVVILFVVNLLVLFGIWISPELRVSMYGQDEGALAGSYAKPSPWTTEAVTTAAFGKPRQPEKVHPVLYQEPQPVEAADLYLPRTTMPVASERTARAGDTDRIVESYSEFPRMTASAARPGDQVRHVGTVDLAPRRVTEQPQP